jgi:hypothetical protein
LVELKPFSHLPFRGAVGEGFFGFLKVAQQKKLIIAQAMKMRI